MSTINLTGVDPYGGASLPLECRRYVLEGRRSQGEINLNSLQIDLIQFSAGGWGREFESVYVRHPADKGDWGVFRQHLI